MRSLYPSLFQINTRVWLTELSRNLHRPATLDDIPDTELDRLAQLGFDWIWMLSVWQTGPGAQRVSRTNREWRKEFEETLPDLREEDIGGSGFAITGYTVHQSLGGDAALARMRDRLRQRGLKLMLDFVPNHTGLDHPWIEDHLEYYVSRNRIRVGPDATELHASDAQARRRDRGARTRSILSWLAGYASTRLQQSARAGRHDRATAEDRRPV